MNARSKLPNARLIDWVIESLKDNPKLWSAAWSAAWRAAWDATRGAARDAAWRAAWDATRDAVPYEARDAARDAAWRAAWDATRGAALDAARGAIWGAIMALVAYDDCDQYLSMTYDELRVWALLSERPQAVLLLPMKWVQEHEHETLVTTA